MNRPAVSVVMITYGHENYIEEAIKGVLMQECNFDVELIISNDCSPDKTDIIINQILKNHSKSNWIRYTKHNQNIGIMPNFVWALKQVAAEYVALCEGDDYWTDPLKLQKQVDFLQENSDFGLVYTDAKIYNEEYNIFHAKTFNYYYKNKPHSDNYFHYLLQQNSIQTLTVLCRKDFLMNALENLNDVIENFKMGDYPLWIEISRLSKVKYFNYVTAVYRKSSNTASSHGDVEKRYEFLQSSFDIQFYFCEKYNLFEEKEKLTIKYNRFQCYRAFDLKYYKIEREILRMFLPNSIKDKLIKFSFNSYFSNVFVRGLFSLEKICSKIFEVLKSLIIKFFYNIFQLNLRK